MATPLLSVTFDARDVSALARFWAEALEWQLVKDDPEETVVAPTSGPGIPLIFVPVDDSKISKNRVHLDLASASEDDLQQKVQRLLGLGATHADIGQHDVPWTVMADPEGNEFCVVPPLPVIGSTGPLATVVLDCHVPHSLEGFWSGMLGWQEVRQTDTSAWLQSPAGYGPVLLLLQNDDPKDGKNRLHFDLASRSGDDQHQQVTHAESAGAVRVDIGQGDVPWVVMADPEGNEFCVLSPGYLEEVGPSLPFDVIRPE